MSTKIPFIDNKNKIEELYKNKGYKVLNYIGEYKGGKTKLIMDCPIHGEWNTSCINHLINGHSCPKCGISVNRLAKLKHCGEKFIIDSMNIHSNKYTYNNFEYKRHNIKSFITCKLHGDYLQTPNDHLSRLWMP